MSSNINIIYSKLKNFSKKYFLNKIIKGTVFFILIAFLSSFLFLLLEYIFYLHINIKFILIVSYLIFLLSVFIYLVVLPSLKYFDIIKGLSNNKINSLLIGLFPEIKDKLLNIIELYNDENIDIYSKDLIIASINQKIEEIRYIDFNFGISFKENLKFIYILILSILFSGLLFLLNPGFYKDSSFRLINYKMSFQKPLPYEFKIINEGLSIGKGDDFNLGVYIKGIKENENVSIVMAGKTFLMKKDSVNFYSYKFNNVNNSIYFQISIDNYNSTIFKIELLEKPIINQFSFYLEKPEYTSLKNEELKNITDFTIPVGTNVKFKFSTIHTDTVVFKDNNFIKYLKEESDDMFIFENKILNDKTIKIDLKNNSFNLNDYLKINIKTIKDEFPSISLVKYADSIEFTRVYFKGKIDDDYGFDKLTFSIKINDKIDSVIELNILKNIREQEFFYAFDFNFYKSINENISYYFEIFDNDIVTGPKSAISEVFLFKFPDKEEINDFQNQQYDEIENIMQNSQNLADKLKEDLNDLKKKMLNNDLSEWDKKEIEKSISSTKTNLEKEIEKIRDKNDELQNYLKSFSEQDQKILEKQNQIQELLKDVFSDELKKLLDEFNKMMQDFNKNEMNTQKEKLDISLDDLSKQLDRNLALLKKMQVEQKLDMLSKDLKQIIDQQNRSIEKLENKLDKENCIKEQNEIKDKIESLEKDYNEIKKLNEGTEEPLNLYDFSNEFNEIKNEFKNSTDNLKNGSKKKGKESMQKNSGNMKNLDFNLSQMMENLFKKENSESIDELNQILDNLITFSFNQEKTINSTKNVNFNSITFLEQKKLFSDFTIIKDSLYSLAKREPSINSPINLELVAIQNDFVSIEDDFENNIVQRIPVNQQKVLTSVNNLSLFISEIIKKLQEQQANSKPGNSNCNKPGNKPNPKSMNSSMKSMQKSLQSQLEKIMQMMKDGKSGKAIQNEMGKAVSQQEAMHDMLQKLMNQGNVGSNAYETLKQADQLLDKVKDDILRNNISTSTIDRQKQILTRLLEAEKSENERDLDEKRKSNTAKEQFNNKTFLKSEEKDFGVNYQEKILKNKLILNSFYQEKFQNYILTLDSINGGISKNRVNSK